MKYLSGCIYEILNVKTLIEINSTLIKKINLKKSSKIIKLNPFSKKFINSKSNITEKFKTNDIKKNIIINAQNIITIMKGMILFIIYMF